MSDTSHVIGTTGIAKKLVDLGDSTYADAVVDYGVGSIQETKNVLAAPTGSDGGLGKLAATMANTEVIYVRCDTSDRAYSYVDWVVSHAQQADILFFKSNTIEDEVTLTLASFTEADTIILNGLTLTGESTATDAAFASRKFYTGGGTDTLDAVELAKLINADYAIVPDGSVAVADTIVVVANGVTYTYTAAATPDYANAIFDQSGNQAAELASIVLAINHKDNVTCASVAVADTVTVGGIVYTAKAGAENTATHYFSKDTSNDATGTSLAACVNADTATHGISASNSSGVVSFTRASRSAIVGLASSNGTRLACVEAAGVPGVVAAATGATGELSLTPTWVYSLTASASPVTHITVTDIDVPGVYAVAADAVVTLTPGVPGAPVGQELATVISATAAARCTVSQAATLAGLWKDINTDTELSAMATNAVATTGTAGAVYSQPVGGYDYCYLGFTADNATPQAVSVSAIKRV